VRVEFRVLGPLEAVVDGNPVALGGPKQRAVLALLLVHANEVVPAERILGDVWPSARASSATRSLQVYVSSLRKALGGAASVLETAPGGYRLAVSLDDVDAARFERLEREGRRAAETGDAARSSELLREALGLWRGPVLADLRYEEFAQAEIGRLEELRLAALEARIDADLAVGRHEELGAELEALVEEHPLREPFRRQLMLARYRSGRQADALAAYRDARRLLREQLGLEPGLELRQLEQAILRQDPSLLVEPQELNARRRLPSPATALVGRRQEVDELTALVRGEARLVTLTGPGGTGKTRVALQAAHELADAFPHGVVFVGVAALRDAELVPSQIAAVLGVEDGLAQHLRERSMLLLIDNFEQVDDAAPALGALLADAPGVRLLVTSRHPLRLYGEHEFPVPPLAAEEAVELFAARARAVRRGFAPSPAVAELCRLLDRLPLAIELVAARVRERSPDELLAELPRRLELAVGGPRDAPERHRTLWATIDWSFELLDQRERELFARLAVFAGGAMLDDVDAVCRAETGEIGALVDKSLVLENDGRVGMLETIREYALVRLEESGTADELRRRHAEHYLAVVLSGKDVRRTPAEVHWFDRLDQERENLRAALEVLLEHDVEAAAQLADGGYRFWYTRGHFEDGLRACERVLERGENLLPRLRANLLTFGSAFAFGRRDLARASALAEEALRSQRELGELDAIARGLVLVGTIATESGSHQQAIRALEEAVEVAREHGEAIVLNFALAHLVMATVAAGLYDRTRELGEEALAATREAGDAESEATLLDNLGLAALRTGDWSEGAGSFAASLAFSVRRADPVAMLGGIESIAAVAAAAGEARSAARLLGAAETLGDSLDLRLEALNVRLREDTVAALRAALPADELLEHWESGRELTLEAAAAEAADLAGRLAGHARPR
jgi:predicted ATPase/DNA-binding SARP family transcriptional activator